MSTAYLKLSSTVGNTPTTVPLSWSSAALSTFSPIANFDIENSFWNYRSDYPHHLVNAWLIIRALGRESRLADAIGPPRYYFTSLNMSSHCSPKSSSSSAVPAAEQPVISGGQCYQR